MNNNNSILPLDDIQSKIFTIRGIQVMLDKDIAHFYEVKPTRLREQVKRNIGRFPDDFMFQLTESELGLLVSQNATPSKQQFGGYYPYVFSEQGVAAISAIIKSKKAEEVSVLLMRAFVKMRKFISNNSAIFQRIENIELKQLKSENKIEYILNALEQNEVTPKQGIFFDGQIFDAYKFVSDLIKSADKSIIIIDNYIDDSVLTILDKRNVNVTAKIYTAKISKQLQLDIKKHNQQYPEIIIEKYDKSHDRFIIIDNKKVFHLGASLKDLGRKWFAFSQINSLYDEIMLKLKKNDTTHRQIPNR